MHDVTAAVWNRRTREIFNELFRTADDKASFETFINAERGGSQRATRCGGIRRRQPSFPTSPRKPAAGRAPPCTCSTSCAKARSRGALICSAMPSGALAASTSAPAPRWSKLLMGQAPAAQAAILRAITERQTTKVASAQSRQALGKLLARGLISGTVQAQSGQ